MTAENKMFAGEDRRYLVKRVIDAESLTENAKLITNLILRIKFLGLPRYVT